MTRAAFHAAITSGLFRGSLPSWQRDPVDLIVDEGLRRARPICDIAYALATAYHETGRFKYDEEIGGGLGREYCRPVTLIRGASATYHGRGFVQLTWLRNYAVMGLYLSLEHGRVIDLVNNPDLAKMPDYASLILWEGMVRGTFTGKNLADYRIGDDALDYREARRIVNGTDKADLIAGYARQFEDALDLITDERNAA